MEQFEKERLIQYFADSSFSEYRYSVSLSFKDKYVCDILRCNSPDVGRIVVDALTEQYRRKYDGVQFILDDNNRSRNLCELLEVLTEDAK